MLTYNTIVTDSKVLYRDFANFNKRFQYWSQKIGSGKAEYVCAIEFMGEKSVNRFHAHVLYIWQRKAPYIPRTTLEKIWKSGFVHCQALKKDNDNPGAYLTAYLADFELPKNADPKLYEKIFTIVTHEFDGKKKKYIKGGRLHLYPANFQLYRCSKGVKRPTVEYMSQQAAQKKSPCF